MFSGIGPVDQAEPEADHGGVAAIAGLELAQQVADLGLDGVVRHHQLTGNLTVALAGDRPGQHLALPEREPLGAIARSGAASDAEQFNQLPLAGDAASTDRADGRQSRCQPHLGFRQHAGTCNLRSRSWLRRLQARTWASGGVKGT